MKESINQKLIKSNFQPPEEGSPEKEQSDANMMQFKEVRKSGEGPEESFGYDEEDEESSDTSVHDAIESANTSN